ncbi:MAG TPA: pitrilysin family protein [Blastocatellia bacterium]|nr:pitrilysin family protein [Blastocatellia bacterium]HMV82514.1 pitrilysin family protein [Blastocatellia bacterium]HMX24672.1 pitrilysin family protein [Blastocatellia bacterium]HMY73070.1 pitrilysin family protein [Blastocatellia bacterium]HMZ18916.1 pitrilysin family protein [Blastocatellia bacterium]
MTFTKITEYEGITEYKLEANGLKVLLAPRRAAPVAALMVVYRVGSRNEAVGHTGATHLLEHMLFKGTPTYNKQNGTQIAAVLQKQGAVYNADTWFDRTRYYEMLPSDQLELAIHLEADRMRNSFIADSDRQSEMTVVRNEMERGENEPSRILDERVWAMAFREHPYHHPTIGWRSDVEGMPTTQLKEFYDVYYHPNNATAIVVGDFDEPAALDLIAKHFGSIPASPHPIPPMYTTEPKQEGEIRFKLRRAGQLGLIELGWHIPEATHADTAVLSVLDHILSAGVTSRLYQALVETQLAVDESAQAFQFIDPGLFTIDVTLRPESTHEAVEKVVLDEIEKLKLEDVTDKELQKAKNIILTQMIFLRDSPFGVVSALGESEAVADWKLYANLPKMVEAVTAADIRRVANTYFTEDNRTVGWFIPKEETE